MRAWTMTAIASLALGPSCGWLWDDCSEQVTCAGSVCINACAAETAEEFCERLEKDCGLVSAPDNRGAMRVQNCGTCPVGKACTEQKVCR